MRAVRDMDSAPTGLYRITAASALRERGTPTGLRPDAEPLALARFAGVSRPRVDDVVNGTGIDRAMRPARSRRDAR